jgi:hypothetical protein
MRARTRTHTHTHIHTPTHTHTHTHTLLIAGWQRDRESALGFDSLEVSDDGRAPRPTAGSSAPTAAVVAGDAMGVEGGRSAPSSLPPPTITPASPLSLLGTPPPPISPLPPPRPDSPPPTCRGMCLSGGVSRSGGGGALAAGKGRLESLARGVLPLGHTVSGDSLCPATAASIAMGHLRATHSRSRRSFCCAAAASSCAATNARSVSAASSPLAWFIQV